MGVQSECQIIALPDMVHKVFSVLFHYRACVRLIYRRWPRGGNRRSVCDIDGADNDKPALDPYIFVGMFTNGTLEGCAAHLGGKKGGMKIDDALGP